jgi:hypothetical protein
MNAYLWLLLGILFRLPEISQKAIESQAAAQLASESGQV